MQRRNIAPVAEIILDGIVEYVPYEDKNHIADYIGVSELKTVKTFDGEKHIRSGNTFAFCPEMEQRIAWRRREANVRMAFSDAPIEPENFEKRLIESYYGEVDSKCFVHYSELSGHLWTDEDFKVGGHDLLEILKRHEGQFCHIELELFKTEKS